jgi:hypothetical protein
MQLSFGPFSLLSGHVSFWGCSSPIGRRKAVWIDFLECRYRLSQHLVRTPI